LFRLLLAIFVLCSSALAPPLLKKCAVLSELATEPGPYDPHMGTYDPIRSSKDSDAYILAVGVNGTTTIVRQIPHDPSKRSYVVKWYEGLMKFAIEAPGYRLLEKVYKQPSEGAFEVLPAEFASVPKVVFLPDVRGRNLPEVLADARVDPEIKEALRDAYKKRMADFDRRIATENVSVRTEGEQDGLPTVRIAVTGDRVNNITNLSIRASQVVVSFDPANPKQFRMTLVDPY